MVFVAEAAKSDQFKSSNFSSHDANDEINDDFIIYK